MVRYQRMSFVNLLGLEVVTFDFRLSFSHGGNLHGAGQFLHGLSVRVEELRVLWGFQFSVGAQAQNVFNFGTTQDPIACAELVLSWDLSTYILNLQGSTSFLVRGDGQVYPAG